MVRRICELHAALTVRTVERHVCNSFNSVRTELIRIDSWTREREWANSVRTEFALWRGPLA